jgi:hypothetical protein
MLACALEPGVSARVVLGCQGGTLNVVDLTTSRRVSQVCRAGVCSQQLPAAHCSSCQDVHLSSWANFAGGYSRRSCDPAGTCCTWPHGGRLGGWRVCPAGSPCRVQGDYADVSQLDDGSGHIACWMQIGHGPSYGLLPCVQLQHATAAHSAGLIAMDAKADLVATAGYGTRQGTVVAETHVKVGSSSARTSSPASPGMATRRRQSNSITRCGPGV